MKCQKCAKPAVVHLTEVVTDTSTPGEKKATVEIHLCLDHAVAAVQVYGLTDYHAKNAIAMGRLKTEFKGKVEVLPLPTPVLRDLKKLAADVVREESERSSIARKVHASFTKFQALVAPWDRVAEGAYHQLVPVG